jgi:hypothetical protein
VAGSAVATVAANRSIDEATNVFLAPIGYVDPVMPGVDLMPDSNPAFLLFPVG